MLNYRTFSPLSAWLVALVTVAVASTALAQKRPPLPKAKVFSEEKADKLKRKAPPKRTGPTFTLDTARTKRQAQATEKREAAIAVLLEALDIEDPSSDEYPKMLIKLADQYWQKAEDYGDAAQSEEVLKCIYDAEEAKDTAALQKCRAKQAAFLAEQNKWRQQTVITYQQIEKDHPNYKDLDTVLYSLGYHTTQMGQPDLGYQYYAKLVLQRPTSPLIPDTYLNIGDYFFGHKNDFQQALAFYNKVEQFGQTRVLGYAIYKSGWCWFNLDDKAKAMNRFYDTIKWTRQAEKAGNPVALDLRSEAQVDMVRAYSFIGAPNKAVGFFKKIAPQIYITLCEKLGDLYTADAAYGSANRLYKSLIEEVGDDHRALKYQREIVYNTFKAGDKQGTKDEIGALSAMLTKYVGTMPDDFKKEQMAELEQLLAVIGTDYHREAEKTLERPTQLLALFVYEEYLKWFPNAKNYYDMTFNVALLAFQMKEWERAANLFEKVIELDPKGRHAAISAHTSLLSYRELIPVNAPEEKKRDGSLERLEPLPIPAPEQRLVKAAERYISIAGKDDIDVPESKYIAGAVYYEYNHFKKATPQLIDLYENHPNFPQLQDAARMLLTVYNVTNDIDNLEKYADLFSSNPAVNKGEFAEVITRIQEQRAFNRCRKLEFQKEYADAGDCFMAYFSQLPAGRRCKEAAVSLRNAAVMYKDAKLVERALAASEQLYNECQASPEAPQALFNIGSIYKAIAVYSESAYYYELYAKNHPKHSENLLRKALARAAQYRRALGQYDEAADNYVNYYKRFSKDQDAGDIFFEIGLIYENQNNWNAVLKHFKKYLRSYGKTAPPGHLIAAHTKMGIAHWSKKKRKPALKEFGTALELFQQMQEDAKAKGGTAEISEGGIDAVAAAKFYEGEVVLEEMKKVKLKLPQKVFTARLAKKIELIGEATDRMSEVAQYERPHWEIAAFNRIGQAYQNLSEAIENAPLPRGMDEEQKFMVREEFNKKANEVRAKAIEAYTICLERAKKKQWFNEFSDNAEKNLARLDLNYKHTREVRPQPTFYRPNAAVPEFAEGPKPKNGKAPFRDANKASLLIRDWTKDTSLVNDVVAKIEAHKEGAMAAKATYNLGLVDVHKRLWSPALEKFKQAAQLDPNFSEAHAMVGFVMHKMGQAGAETHFAKAKSLAKFSPMALNVEAVAAQGQSNWTGSVALSRKALIGNAESVNAYLNLARSYYKTGQFDLARLVCQQALEFRPHSAPLHNMLGLTYLKLDNVRAALREFVRATEGDPNSVEGHLNLASTVLNYSDFTRAKKHFQRAGELEPGNLDAMLGAAVADRGLEAFDDAVAGYDKLLEKRPNDPDLLYNKCLTLSLYTDRYEAALPVCEAFVANAPADHPKRKEIEKRIPGIKDTIRFLEEDRKAAEEEKKRLEQEGKNPDGGGDGGGGAAPDGDAGDEGDPEAAPSADAGSAP